jgi:hypothetical protein
LLDVPSSPTPSPSTQPSPAKVHSVSYSHSHEGGTKYAHVPAFSPSPLPTFQVSVFF